MHYVTGDNEAGHASTTVYGGAMARQTIPRYEMNEEELDPRAAKRFIADELQLDGTPALNLASFVTTYMEPEAEELMRDNLNKNFIDVEEYPSLGDIESRCVNIVAKLFNAPTSGEHNALGVSTVGSSEAIILAVLAAKRRWQKARRDAGKDTSKPNLVMNAAVQVCWEKAARYLEVEERYWFTKPGQYAADPKELIDLVDENTILVCAILGTTYTGEYEDVQEINRLLEEKNKKDSLNVHIHVDAASGGFVAPFVVPDLVWDFRNSLVCSINTSGHKYQLTYAGIGYLVLRDKSFLPDEIVFTVNYLGSPQISFTLNFSKSGVQLIASYYQMLRLGKSGYRAIMYTLTETADYLSKFVEEYDGGKKFKIISQTGGKGLPLVAWSIKPESNTKWDEFALARGLRQKGWIVPAYTMAPHSEKLKLMRVVIREDFSRSRAEAFIRDLTAAIKTLDETPTPVLDHDKEKNGPKESGDEKKPNHKHAVHHEKHSLRGKYGKTHAVC